MNLLALVSVIWALASAVPSSRVPRRAIHYLNPRLDGRIVGGVATEIERRPYQISLQFNEDHICGGSIVSEFYIVTAAHCTVFAWPSDLTIRAGSSLHYTGGVVVKVRDIFEHELYDDWTLDYDVSVLLLEAPLSFRPSIRPVNLPARDQHVEAGTASIVSGWGTLNEADTTIPAQLQEVTVPIVSLEVCREAYGALPITDRMICAGLVGVGGKDACQGDSGGPLVVQTTEESYTLVGIVSWGYGCARPWYPGVYSNVAALREFIERVVGF